MTKAQEKAAAAAARAQAAPFVLANGKVIHGWITGPSVTPGKVRVRTRRCAVYVVALADQKKEA